MRLRRLTKFERVSHELLGAIPIIALHCTERRLSQKLRFTVEERLAAIQIVQRRRRASKQLLNIAHDRLFSGAHPPRRVELDQRVVVGGGPRARSHFCYPGGPEIEARDDSGRPGGADTLQVAAYVGLV